jgi:hypothetical protein
MKISKSLLKIIAVAVVIGTTTACKKEQPVNPEDTEQGLKKQEGYNCFACGMG